MSAWFRRVQAAIVAGATPVIAIAGTCLVPVNYNNMHCQTDCSSFIFCPVFGECKKSKSGYAGCAGAYAMVRCTYNTGGNANPPGCCTGGVPESPPRYSGGEYPAFIAVPVGDKCEGSNQEG